MDKIEAIVNELTKMGYTVDVQKVVKNGVEKHGIMIDRQGKSIVATVYAEDFIKNYGDDFHKIAEEMATFVNSARVKDAEREKNKIMQVLSDKNYIKRHIVIALQRVSTEVICKKETILNGVEAYLRISFNNFDGMTASVKVTKDILRLSGIAEDEAWEAALFNTKNNSELITMYDTFKKTIPEELLNGAIEEMQNTYIIRSILGTHGAASICNLDLLHEFAEKMGVDKIVIIPSSIHECILMAWGDEYSMEFFSEMVKIVNDTEVVPEDQLADEAFLIDVNECKSILSE